MRIWAFSWAEPPFRSARLHLLKPISKGSKVPISTPLLRTWARVRVRGEMRLGVLGMWCDAGLGVRMPGRYGYAGQLSVWGWYGVGLREGAGETGRRARVRDRHRRDGGDGDGGELVEPAAVHNHRHLDAQIVQRLTHERHELLAVDADEEVRARGWVEQRAEDVEDGTHAKRLGGLENVLERRRVGDFGRASRPLPGPPLGRRTAWRLFPSAQRAVKS